MLNEQRKIDFVTAVYKDGAPRADALRVLKRAGTIEDRLGKDICDMSKDEVTDVLSEVCGVRTKSKYQRISVIQSYIRWCSDEYFSTILLRKKVIKPGGFEKVRVKMISTPEHLQKSLDSICYPVHEGTSDNMIRVFCWMLYAGIEPDEAVKVTNSNINIEDRKIDIGKQTVYTIYEESVPTFKSCMNMKRIARYRNPDDTEWITFKRVDGDILVRGYKNVPTASSMRMLISMRCRDKSRNSESDIKSEISPTRLMLSGLFYRHYLAEREGLDLDFTEEALKLMRDKEEDPLSAGYRERFLNAKNMYQKDYDAWKKAFDL